MRQRLPQGLPRISAASCCLLEDITRKPDKRSGDDGEPVRQHNIARLREDHQPVGCRVLPDIAAWLKDRQGCHPDNIALLSLSTG
jgi:hypothetical protein